MDIIELLRRVAAARGGEAGVVLVCGEHEIACRDEWQAMMVERVFQAFVNEAAPQAYGQSVAADQGC